MSDTGRSKVFLADNSDAGMQEAVRRAQTSFGYFWREVAWERRRIIPGLDLACVKAPFSDGEADTSTRGNPSVEQMWLGDVDFDGQFVSGTLLNSPNWVKSVKAGDEARLRLNEITDWMYAIDGVVYGAFTVNLLRSRMEVHERNDHDRAWGLDFGDPHNVKLVPAQPKTSGTGTADIPEHPMSESMAPSLRSRLTEDRSMLRAKDDRGWELMHDLALAGSAAGVAILLECGADPNAITADGMTPLQLARSLGWNRVVSLLISKGAK